MKSASAGRTSGPHRRSCSRQGKHGRTLRERVPATASGSPKRLKLEDSIPRAKDWVTAILSGDLRGCASSRSRMRGGRSMKCAASAASHGYGRCPRARARVTRLIQTGGTRGTAANTGFLGKAEEMKRKAKSRSLERPPERMKAGIARKTVATTKYAEFRNAPERQPIRLKRMGFTNQRGSDSSCLPDGGRRTCRHPFHSIFAFACWGACDSAEVPSGRAPADPPGCARLVASQLCVPRPGSTARAFYDAPFASRRMMSL